MRQFVHRNLSTPEQRARAAALFLRIQFIVYFMIMLGIGIFIAKVFL